MLWTFPVDLYPGGPCSGGAKSECWEVGSTWSQVKRIVTTAREEAYGRPFFLRGDERSTKILLTRAAAQGPARRPVEMHWVNLIVSHLLSDSIPQAQEKHKSLLECG